MATTVITCIAIVAMCITTATAQQTFRQMNGRRPPFDRPRFHRHAFGPCLLEDGAGHELEQNDCPVGRTCSVGPIELESDGETTINAYFCTPSVLPPRCGPCRIERDGVVVQDEVECPHGNTCDVGPHDYRDGDVILSAFYCRRNPGKHLCGVTSPDGKIVGARACSDDLVCDLDTPMNTYENNYSIYACRRPMPPREVCRVERSDGTIIEEEMCADGSSCETEAYPFQTEGETYMNFYCPRNADDYDWMSPCGGGPGSNGGCCGRSGGCGLNGRSRGRFHHGHMGRSMGRSHGGPSGHHSGRRGRSWHGKNRN